MGWSLCSLDLIAKLLVYVNIHDVDSLQCVDKLLCELLSDDDLWQKIFFYRVLSCGLASNQPSKAYSKFFESWKKEYINTLSHTPSSLKVILNLHTDEVLDVQASVRFDHFPSLSFDDKLIFSSMLSSVTTGNFWRAVHAIIF